MEIKNPVTRKPGTRAVFFALFGLSGGFLLLLSVPNGRLGQTWPLLMCLSGLSLYLAGLYHRKHRAISYLVPSVGLFCLGLIFLLFSLNFIKERFFVFIIRWWPVTVIVVGVTLLLLFFVRRKKASSEVRPDIR
jgi:cell division protein FtsW (lipid II flippase)